MSDIFFSTIDVVGIFLPSNICIPSPPIVTGKHFNANYLYNIALIAKQIGEKYIDIAFQANDYTGDVIVFYVKDIMFALCVITDPDTTIAQGDFYEESYNITTLNVRATPKYTNEGECVNVPVINIAPTDRDWET